MFFNKIYQVILFMNLALVLSGGGVKGTAHIGVKFNFISGTSSGGTVEVLYASVNSSDEIYKIFKNYCKEIKYWDFKNRIFIKISYF